MDQVSPEGRVQLLPKASDNLQTSVRDYHLQNSMQAWHASNVDLRILLSIITGVNGYEMGRLGESIYDHPD
jgi:hypothetical protein